MEFKADTHLDPQSQSHSRPQSRTITPAPQQDMTSLRLPQPFDLTRYQHQSQPYASSGASGLHLLQLSNDRSRFNHSPLVLPWPPTQTQAPAPPPPSTQASNSPPQYLNYEYAQPQSQSQPRSAPSDQSTFPSVLIEGENKSSIRRALGLEPPLPLPSWTEKGYTSQSYEPPFQNPSSLSISSNSFIGGHSHSHSTPIYTPSALRTTDTPTPYQSNNSTPLQHAATFSYAHSDSTPLQRPLSLDGFKAAQPDWWYQSDSPSSRWGSQRPYQQPQFDEYGAPDRNEEQSKKARLMKTRRHVCPVCDKRFNRPSSLNTHMSVHTGAKPFICSRADCGRRFSVSSNLRRHERTHETRAARERPAVFQPRPRGHGQLPSDGFYDASQSPSFSYSYYQPYSTPPLAAAPSSGAAPALGSGPMLDHSHSSPALTTVAFAGSAGHGTRPNSTADVGDVFGQGHGYASSLGGSELAQDQLVTRPKREIGRCDQPRRSALSYSHGIEALEMDTKAEMLLS